jgi:hypothetical protein
MDLDNSVYVPHDLRMIDDLLKLSDCFCAATGIAETTLSSRIFNDGKRLTAVRGGADIGARRLERAIEWLSAHWPSDTAWPDGVRRPAPVAEAAE